jgi:hypothetical protein
MSYGVGRLIKGSTKFICFWPYSSRRSGPNKAVIILRRRVRLILREPTFGFNSLEGNWRFHVRILYRCLDTLGFSIPPNPLTLSQEHAEHGFEIESVKRISSPSVF